MTTTGATGPAGGTAPSGAGVTGATGPTGSTGPAAPAKPKRMPAESTRVQSRTSSAAPTGDTGPSGMTGHTGANGNGSSAQSIWERLRPYAVRDFASSSEMADTKEKISFLNKSVLTINEKTATALESANAANMVLARFIDASNSRVGAVEAQVSDLNATDQKRVERMDAMQDAHERLGHLVEGSTASVNKLTANVDNMLAIANDAKSKADVAKKTAEKAEKMAAAAYQREFQKLWLVMIPMAALVLLGLIIVAVLDAGNWELIVDSDNLYWVFPAACGIIGLAAGGVLYIFLGQQLLVRSTDSDKK